MKMWLLEATLDKIVILILFINIIEKTDASSDVITRQYLLLSFIVLCKLYHLILPNRFVFSRKIVLRKSQAHLQ